MNGAVLTDIWKIMIAGSAEEGLAKKIGDGKEASRHDFQAVPGLSSGMAAIDQFQPAQISSRCNCRSGNAGPAPKIVIPSKRWGAPLAGHTSTACW